MKDWKSTITEKVWQIPQTRIKAALAISLNQNEAPRRMRFRWEDRIRNLWLEKERKNQVGQARSHPWSFSLPQIS